jgi:hypothetical protein
MKPEVKASITLPLAIVILGFLFYLIATNALIVGWGLIIIALVAILGSLWYSLYVMFGGEDGSFDIELDNDYDL